MGDSLYYVMPLVEGASLRQRLSREGALPIGDAVRIFREVAEALAHAHRHGVVHRDIKPENVMLSERHALVTDFGVARAVSEASAGTQLTSVGMAIGTPAYMAPEQAAADPKIDARADIYALGVMAYEMLAGRLPFDFPTPQAMLAAHVTQAPDPISRYRSSVPADLEAVVARCLAKQPADRWQSADELVARLEAMPSGATTPVETSAVPAATGVRTAARRPIAQWLGAAAAVIVLIAAAVLLLRPRGGGGGPALDQDLIAAFPFRVTSQEPAMRQLREGIVDILQASMGTEQGPRVLAAQTAIKTWQDAGGNDERDLSSPEALALSRRLGAGQLLEGSVISSPQGLVLSGTLTPVDGGRPVQGRAEGPADSILTLVDQLMAQLLSLRAGDEAGRASSLSHVPLRALQSYLDGQRAWRGGRWEEAFEAFGSAVAHDSTFALAGFYQALAATWIVPSPPNRGGAIARANLGRLSPRDRLLVETYVTAVDDSTYSQSFADRERMAGQLADRAEAWYLYADLVFHYGAVSGLRDSVVKDRAWAGFNRGLSLDPNFGPILAHRFDQALGDRDSARLRQLADSFPENLAGCGCRLGVYTRLGDSAALAVERAKMASVADYTRGAFDALFVGQPDEGQRMLEEALRRAGSGAERRQTLGIMWVAALTTGRPGWAQELTRRIEAERPSGSVPLNADGDAIMAAMFSGARDSAAAQAAGRRLTERAVAVGAGTPTRGDLTAVLTAGLWAAWANERQTAVRLHDLARGWSARLDMPHERHRSRVAAAMLDLVTADLATAPSKADALDQLMSGGPRGTPDMRNAGNILLARAFRDQGRLDRAYAAAGRQDWFHPLTAMVVWREQLELSLAVGDTARFLRDVTDYLRWRRNAEPEQIARDEPLRAELARLTGEPRPAGDLRP